MTREEAMEIAKPVPSQEVSSWGTSAQNDKHRLYTDEDESAFGVLGVCKTIVAIAAFVGIGIWITLGSLLSMSPGLATFIAFIGIGGTLLLWFMLNGIFCYMSGIYRNIAEINGKRKE